MIMGEGHWKPTEECRAVSDKLLGDNNDEDLYFGMLKIAWEISGDCLVVLLQLAQRKLTDGVESL